MSFLTPETERQYVEWFRGFSNGSLARHISVMERLIDSNDFAESLLIDDGIRIYDLLRDECVRRVSLMSRYESKKQNVGCPLGGIVCDSQLFGFND